MLGRFKVARLGPARRFSKGETQVALTELDRQLISRCLERETEAWCEFVDRYMGVVFHVIQHAAHMRNVSITKEETEDLAADVMATIVDGNFKILRRFRGKSSLASYLAVIARRVVVNKLARRAIYERKLQAAKQNHEDRQVPPELKIDNEDEVHRMLDQLDGRDAELIRAYYLDQKSYGEIAQELSIPENTIGPTLSRLREHLRRSATPPN